MITTRKEISHTFTISLSRSNVQCSEHYSSVIVTASLCFPLNTDFSDRQTAQRKSDPMPLPGLRSEGNCQLLLPVSVGDACARNKPMQHTVSLLP